VTKLLLLAKEKTRDRERIFSLSSNLFFIFGNPCIYYKKILSLLSLFAAL